MAGKSTIGAVMIPAGETAEFHGKLVAMNEELMLRSMLQHQLAEVALAANARLQDEIAGRKKVETALRDSEKRYRTLFDLGPVAIYSCDASGRIDKFNRRAAELWGRKPAEGDTAERFCGSLKLFRPDGSFMPHQQCPMASVLKGQIASMRDAEVIIERPDGSRVVVVVDIRPVKNALGKVTGAINCFYDITERKQAEETQRRLAVMFATTQKLQQEMARRRKVEQALRKSERHQRQSLIESRKMRDQLRSLSRQLLLAQEEERKRISRDLHDVVAQTLTGINLRLASLKADATLNFKHRERNITRAQRLVEHAVKAVHQFARELRPTVLDDLGVIPALHTFLKTFKEKTGIHVSLSAFAAVEEEKADKLVVLYRIVQESVTNVARHAKASRVEVSIQKQHDAVCLTIKDNGHGFPVRKLWDGQNNNRLGLIGMRERLEMVGGKFTIESVSGQGTTVTAQIPLEKARAKAAR